MANRSAGVRRVLALASLFLIGAGGWLGYSEARPYLEGGVLANERFDALLAREIAPGQSTRSKRLVLDNCVDAITSVYGRTQPANRRVPMLQSCLEIADAITAANPTFPLAWYVAGLAADRLSDHTGSAERLFRSELTGPNEQWVAELRWELVEDSYPSLTPEQKAAQDRDLRLLVTSSSGSTMLARRYVLDKGFRDRITGIVETMDQVAQRRFLSAVNAASKRVVGH